MRQMAESLDRYYRILGLGEGASRKDIKRAYRRLALRYHPDKNPGNQERASRIFTAINRAYSVLIDKAHVGESFEDIDEAKLYFRRHFYDLARRIDSTDRIYDEIHQEECDFFFRYQLEHVHCVRRSRLEARRIIDLIEKAISKGYDTSEILKDYSDFFQKHGFDEQPKYESYDDLISEYKRIIDMEPNNAEAHYNLGCVYEKQDMIDAAISEYQIASYIDPCNTRAKRSAERLRKKRRLFR
jgi:curved DNA-binding protein CbpA